MYQKTILVVEKYAIKYLARCLLFLAIIPNPCVILKLIFSCKLTMCANISWVFLLAGCVCVCLCVCVCVCVCVCLKQSDDNQISFENQLSNVCDI